MKRMVFVLSLFLLLMFVSQSWSAMVFPVTELMGDSECPRDAPTSETNISKQRELYTVVYGGKYWGNWDARCKDTGGHPGVDFAVVSGTKVYGVADGVINFAGWNSAWGNIVVIRHNANIFNTSNYTYSVYAHLSSIYVQDNETITAGELIGLSGDSGSGSAGDHLHFQIDKPSNGIFQMPPYYNALDQYNNDIHDTNLSNETIDPIASLESRYPYFVGKFSEGWLYNDITVSYFSDPFVDAYHHNDGYPFESALYEPVSHAIGNVSLYPSYTNPLSGVDRVYIQNLEAKSGYQFALVLNMHVYNMRYGRLGVVYPIHGQIKQYWENNFWGLGAPVTNEYYWPEGTQNYVVQWFEPSDNNFVAVTYNTSTGNFNDGNEQLILDAQYFNQAVYDNTGCPNGVCGTGGGGTTQSDYYYIGSEACSSIVDGPASDPYNRTCVPPSDVFNEGETIYSLTKIGDVFVDHQWRVEVYRDNVLQWSTLSNGWVYPDHDYGWQYSIFETSITNALSGDYTLKMYIDTGVGFELLDTKSFTVPDTKPDYIYESAVVCEDVADGPSGDIYNLQPVNEKSVYDVGDRVYLLAKLHDVYVDHQWKFAVYKNGAFQWDYLSSQMVVDPLWGWAHSVYTPYQDNVSAGNYEFWLYLDDGSGFTLLDKKPFTVLANISTFPYLEDFSSDSHGYVLEDHNTPTSSLYVSNTEGMNGGRGLILNNSSTTDNWKVQVKKLGFNFQQSTSYQGQIYLKADTAGTVYIAVQRDVDPWDNMGMWKTVNVTTSWQAYDIDFTATGNPQLDPDNVRFTIMAGELAGKLYIDDVSFQ